MGFFLCLSATAQAGLLDKLSGEPEFLPVSDAFPYGIHQDGQTLSVILDSADGYYLYKKKLFLRHADSNDKKIKTAPSFLSQEGELKFDEAFGEVIVFFNQLEAEFDLKALLINDASATQPQLTLYFQGCAEAGLCYPPQKISLDIDWQVVAKAAAVTAGSPTENDSSTITTATSSDDASWFSGQSWFSVIALFWLLGLGLTFTPCVLPMVPILTSIVVGQKEHTPLKGFVLSLTYVLGMAITYAVAGVAVGLLGAGANINIWMQTPWVLSLFAFLFVLLALSMFGLYELQLPSGLRNRLNTLNQKQSGGHLIGVFFMGILSALVVSPCVSAPLAGALVYLSTTGDAWLGGSALLALGLGMGTPLIALGTSGASILPKAGRLDG